MTAVRAHLAAVLAYVALAVLVTWPLPLHLGTHLTGQPSGDTGVYVWNIWVFAHEVAQGRLPFYTSAILSATPALGPVNLSLHNYTTFSNLLALPLLPILDVVASFNIVYIINIALSGYAFYLLARDLTGRHAEALMAGALFAAAPMLIARGTAHFSLVAAAPLPLFCLMLFRTMDRQRVRDAVLTGLIVAWAAFCDAYYAVYCLLIAAFSLTAFVLQLRRSESDPVRRPRLLRLLDVLVLIVGGFVIGMAIRGGGPIVMFGLRVSMKTLYTPVLVVSCLVALRLALTIAPHLRLNVALPSPMLLRAGAVAVVAMVLPLSPVLYAFGERYVAGGVSPGPIYWRSSPSGVDLLAFFVPNPNHPWWGAWARDLTLALSHRTNGFPEYAASVPLLVLGLFAFAWWRCGWRPAPRPVAFTLTFAVLALGPFVQVAGYNTHVPTPWALLRYVPAVGMAQSPSRLAIVAMVGVASLFALMLTHLTTRYPQRRRQILTAVGVLLALELLPAPRPLYSAEIPPIYRQIASDPDMSHRVLELPFGVRDGTSSLGNFNAVTQFYQTAHGKGIIGGYVSRVSLLRKHRYQRVPMLDALMTLSEGRPLTQIQTQRADATIDRFLVRTRLKYVVVDRATTSPALLAFASRTLGLSRIAGDGQRDLYLARPPRSLPEPFSDPPAFLDSWPRLSPQNR